MVPHPLPWSHLLKAAPIPHLKPKTFLFRYLFRYFHFVYYPRTDDFSLIDYAPRYRAAGTVQIWCVYEDCVDEPAEELYWRELVIWRNLSMDT